jgi:hypothetical protein
LLLFISIARGRRRASCPLPLQQPGGGTATLLLKNRAMSKDAMIIDFSKE